MRTPFIFAIIILYPLLFIYGLSPQKAVGIPHTIDKLVHLIYYFVLISFTKLALQREKPILFVILSFILAWLLEFLQGALPVQRSREPLDLIMGFTGGAIASLIPIRILEFFYFSLSSLFGIGYIGNGAGTFASLICFVLFFSLPFSKNVWISSLFPLFVITLALSFYYTTKTQNPDPPWFVLDEAFSTFFLLTLLPKKLSLDFFLWIIFRFMDIFKPLGIKKVEKITLWGLGPLLDDVLAAVYTLLIYYVVLKLI